MADVYRDLSPDERRWYLMSGGNPANLTASGGPTTAVREQVAHLMHNTATGLPWPTGDRPADRAERDQYRQGADAVLELLTRAGVLALPTAGRPPRHLADQCCTRPVDNLDPATDPLHIVCATCGTKRPIDPEDTP